MSEAKRLEMVSRARGLSASMREAGFHDAADVVEAAARITHRREPTELAQAAEGPEETATVSIPFVLLDGTFRFQVTPETEALLEAALADLPDVELYWKTKEWLDVSAEAFDAFSRHLGVRGACVADAALHRTFLPLGREVLGRYWSDGGAEPLRSSGAEPPGPLTPRDD